MDGIYHILNFIPAAFHPLGPIWKEDPTTGLEHCLGCPQHYSRRFALALDIPLALGPHLGGEMGQNSIH